MLNLIHDLTKSLSELDGVTRVMINFDNKNWGMLNIIIDSQWDICTYSGVSLGTRICFLVMSIVPVHIVVTVNGSILNSKLNANNFSVVKSTGGFEVKEEGEKKEVLNRKCALCADPCSKGNDGLIICSGCRTKNTNTIRGLSSKEKKHE